MHFGEPGIDLAPAPQLLRVAEAEVVAELVPHDPDGVVPVRPEATPAGQVPAASLPLSVARPAMPPQADVLRKYTSRCLPGPSRKPTSSATSFQKSNVEPTEPDSHGEVVVLMCPSELPA